MSVTIGVDIGGTKIAGGIVGTDGAILARSRKETERDAREVVATIVHVVRDLVAVAERDGLGEVEAVGLGAPGLVDETRKVVRFAPNIDWAEEPLADAVASAAGLPTISLTARDPPQLVDLVVHQERSGRDAHREVAHALGATFAVEPVQHVDHRPQVAGKFEHAIDENAWICHRNVTTSAAFASNNECAIGKARHHGAANDMAKHARMIGDDFGYFTADWMVAADGGHGCPGSAFVVLVSSHRRDIEADCANAG